MTTLFAQPYDIDATGFYFEDAEEYAAKAASNRNRYGQKVEEYEIQFIDGESLDCELAQAMGINQANIGDYLECVDHWEDWQKLAAIIHLGECGGTFEKDRDPADYDIDLYQLASLRELAEQFVDEGIFGEIPDHLANYIDHDAIARDLAAEYSEITIAGESYVYASR